MGLKSFVVYTESGNYLVEDHTSFFHKPTWYIRVEGKYYFITGIASSDFDPGNQTKVKRLSGGHSISSVKEFMGLKVYYNQRDSPEMMPSAKDMVTGEVTGFKTLV